MENLRNDMRPAVNEVDPPVLDPQTFLLLRASLVEEDQITPVVEIPRDAFRGKLCPIRDR